MLLFRVCYHWRTQSKYRFRSQVFQSPNVSNHSKNLSLTDTGDDSKLVHRWKRPKMDTLFSSLFSAASQRRVWLRAELKILASTFGRFRLYWLTLRYSLRNLLRITWFWNFHFKLSKSEKNDFFESLILNSGPQTKNTSVDYNLQPNGCKFF